jgi:hypothetical protein
MFRIQRPTTRACETFLSMSLLTELGACSGPVSYRHAAPNGASSRSRIPLEEARLRSSLEVRCAHVTRSAWSACCLDSCARGVTNGVAQTSGGLNCVAGYEDIAYSLALGPGPSRTVTGCRSVGSRGSAEARRRHSDGAVPDHQHHPHCRGNQPFGGAGRPQDWGPRQHQLRSGQWGPGGPAHCGWCAAQAAFAQSDSAAARPPPRQRAGSAARARRNTRREPAGGHGNPRA